MMIDIRDQSLELLSILEKLDEGIEGIDALNNPGPVYDIH